MALVLLPCDLPSWPTVQRHLHKIKMAKNSAQLVEGMQKLHAICSISLDPDDNESSESNMFIGLKMFVDQVMTDDERNYFFDISVPSLVVQALLIESRRPYNGWRYSLQQQADCTEADRGFVASLLANAFFSTFPKRTEKTHPTLQDCNFCRSFAHLESPLQQRKLCNVLCYFNAIAHREPKGKVAFVRHVVHKSDLFRFDDWLQSDEPLCPVVVRHERKLEGNEDGTCQICFSSSQIGGKVLDGGEKQEDEMFCTFPELFVTMVSTESLENNEALSAYGLQPIVCREDCKMLLKEHLWDDEGLTNTHVCFMDAADFSCCQPSQYLVNNILRDLNKAFVGFRQRRQPGARPPPVGKSYSSSPSKDILSVKDNVTFENISEILPSKGSGVTTSAKEMDTITMPLNEEVVNPPIAEEAEIDGNVKTTCILNTSAEEVSDESTYGDCVEDWLEWQTEDLKGNCHPSFHRPLTLLSCNTSYTSSCPSIRLLEEISMETSFVTCCSSQGSSKESLEGRENVTSEAQVDFDFANCVKDLKETNVVSELKTSENLPVCIAQRDRRKLLDARKEQIQIDFISETDTEGENISFAIDPNVGDGDGRALQRAESTGFVLDDDEDPFSGDGLEHERAWMANFRHRSANPSRSASGKNSSRYSFSSDFSSDLEELYEHFEEMMTQGPIREDPSYVGRLRDKLKRTLSDSLTSLPRAIQEFPRSLSLSEKMQQEKLGIECAKRNVPRFTDCLLRERSAERSKESNSAMASQDCPSSRLLQGTGILGYFRPCEQLAVPCSVPIITGNWGCGEKGGDPRLKALIQWMAASKANVPLVIYHTFGDPKVVKLNIVCRVLLDRRWSVGNVAKAILHYCNVLSTSEPQRGTEEIDLLDCLLPKETEL